MHHPLFRRWLTNAVALLAAVTLTVLLAGRMAGTGVDSLAAPAVDDTAAAEPAVALTADNDLLDRWRDVLRNPGAKTGIAAVSGLRKPVLPSGSTDGLHSLVQIVVPQLLPAGYSDDRRYVITTALDLLFSPLSNIVAGGRWGAYISPLVALGNTAAAVIGDLSGENPDMTAAAWDLAHLPTNLLGGYRNGADLNLAPLARMFTNAGMLPEDFDASSLHIGFGGHSSKTPGLRSHFPRVGALSQVLRHVTLGMPL